MENAAQSYQNAAVTLFQDIYKNTAQPGKNVVCAPPAIMFAILQPALGASGASMKAIQTLFDSAYDIPIIARGVGNHINGMLPEKDAKSIVKFGREMWMSQYDKPTDHFLKRYAYGIENGGTPVMDVNFSSPAATDKINEWVKSGTNGKIDKLFGEPLPDTTQFVAASYIYFKSLWRDANKFDPNNTVDGQFFGSNGAIPVRMMRTKADANYVQTPTYDYVGWPFVDNYEFFAIKPKGSVGSLMDELPQVMEQVTHWNVRRAPVRLHMPRIKIESFDDLTSSLSNGTLAPLTERSGDFRGVSPDIAKIGMLVQKATFECDEKGAEAAAVAASMTMRGMHMPIKPEQVFVLDRPSVIGISSRQQGHEGPLFYVALENPGLGS